MSRRAHLKLSRAFDPERRFLATAATLDELENGKWRMHTIDKASGVGDEAIDFPTRDDAIVALASRGFEVDADSVITLCSVCHSPAHASETDDLDRCAKCAIHVGTFVAWESPNTGETCRGRVQEREEVNGKILLRIKVAGAPGDAIMPEISCRILPKRRT